MVGSHYAYATVGGVLANYFVVRDCRFCCGDEDDGVIVCVSDLVICNYNGAASRVAVDAVADLVV